MSTKAEHREKKFKEWLCGQMAPYWLSQWHEDQFSTGVPDVSWSVCLRKGETTTAISGWLEFKAIESLPKKPSTPIRLDHFTAKQKSWLKNYYQIGVPAYMVVLVEDQGQFALVTPNMFSQIDRWTWDDYHRLCPIYYIKDFHRQTFIIDLLIWAQSSVSWAAADVVQLQKIIY